MNQIDFLPEAFRRRRERQRRRPVEFLLILACGAALFGAWHYVGGPDPALARQAQQLDSDLDRLAQQQAEAQRLSDERDRLSRELKVARETNQPISVAQVLAHLAHLAPEPVRLTDFELVAQRPTPEPLPTVGGAGRPGPRGAQSAERGPNVFRILMTGLAPSDAEVVAYIRALDRSRVFTGVTLRNSKLIKTRTHIAREFQLELVIDLDRRFVPAQRVGGDADAG